MITLQFFRQQYEWLVICLTFDVLVENNKKLRGFGRRGFCFVGRGQTDSAYRLTRAVTALNYSYRYRTDVQKLVLNKKILVPGTLISEKIPDCELRQLLCLFSIISTISNHCG